jgi:hypothetical protein
VYDEWARRRVVGMKEEIKDDECGKSEYRGENLDELTGIFCFERGFEV